MANINEIKTGVLAALAAAGTFLAESFGGWDADLMTLLIFMAVDFLLGLIVAGVFKKSNKSETGALDSRASFKGLCKKGAVLLVVLIAHRLDLMGGGGSHAVRSLVIFFFLGNEGLSIVESLGLMGVPFPKKLTDALEALRRNSDADKGAAPDGDGQ